MPRDDGTFCSRACGCGCTFEAYRAAHTNGEALAKLLGDGWTYRVWENGGWHYEAISPCLRVRVHAHRDGHSAYLGEADSAGGRWVGHHEGPLEAVRAVIATGRAELAKMGAIFESLDY